MIKDVNIKNENSTATGASTVFDQHNRLVRWSESNYICVHLKYILNQRANTHMSMRCDAVV